MQINTQPYIPQLEQLLSKVTSLSLSLSLLFLSLPFSRAEEEGGEEDEEKQRRANEGGGSSGGVSGLMGSGRAGEEELDGREVRGEQGRQTKNDPVLIGAQLSGANGF